MVEMYLATHLTASTTIEDSRKGLPGDQVKLVPTSPDRPSPKFRVIQLWDKYAGTVRAEVTPTNKTPTIKTGLKPFMTQDDRASNRRRWPARRPCHLKDDLVEEERKKAEKYRKTLEEVQKLRSQVAEWQREEDDGMDPYSHETIDEYCTRMKPLFYQKW